MGYDPIQIRVLPPLRAPQTPDRPGAHRCIGQRDQTARTQSLINQAAMPQQDPRPRLDLFKGKTIKRIVKNLPVLADKTGVRSFSQVPVPRPAFIHQTRQGRPIGGLFQIRSTNGDDLIGP